MAEYMVVGLEEDHGRNGWTVNHGILHFCRHADLLKKERSGRDWCSGRRGAHQSRNGLKSSKSSQTKSKLLMSYSTVNSFSPTGMQ